MTDLTDGLRETGWTLEDGGKAILKTFRFRGFRDAMAFMMRAGFEADSANHHPEWSNVYNRVEVRLTTHDSGCLTDKDISLAEKFDKVAGRTLAKEG